MREKAFDSFLSKVTFDGTPLSTRWVAPLHEFHNMERVNTLNKENLAFVNKRDPILLITTPRTRVSVLENSEPVGLVERYYSR